MLGWCQPEIGHQLSWVVETLEISDLGHHRHRDDERDASHRLNRLDHRCQRPARQQICDLASQLLDPRFGIGHRVDIVLKDDLLRRVLEPHRRQPAPVCLGPALLAGIDATVPQQKPLQMLPRLAQNPHRGRPRPNKVAHRLMRRIRHPHRRQLARAVQLRQHHRIAAVRLHPVARLHRDERGRHHDAIMPHLDKLAMQAVAAWSGFIAEMQTPSAGAKLLHQLADMIRAVRNRAPVTDLSATLALCNRDRNRRLMDIQPDEHAILHMVSPPFLRLGTGPSGATLEQRMPRERPPNQSSKALPRYRRLTKKAEALIASVYLSGTNTRRVKRALFALFKGAVSKDVVSRAWRKVKVDWDAWCARNLADEDIVRLILDGTVVRTRIDKRATNVSVLAAIGVRRDGQKVLLSIQNMGGESTAAWADFLGDLDARGLKRPEFVIVDGAPGLEAALSKLWGEDLAIQRCTVHKNRNLLAHAPKHLHEEITADYRDMIYAETAQEVAKRRRAFLRKWRLKCIRHRRSDRWRDMAHRG